MGTIIKQDIFTPPWYRELEQFFEFSGEDLGLSQDLQKTQPVDGAWERIEKGYTTPRGKKLINAVKKELYSSLSDRERSESWRELVGLCVRSEEKGFLRMAYLLRLKRIIQEQLKMKDTVTVVDYGCGSSLLTRILAQAFPNRAHTLSVDVCRPAIDFSVARNKLHNPLATGILIEDVMACPDIGSADFIYANTVFEHLPNSQEQIRHLINALSDDGMLLENYAGISDGDPEKSDTKDAALHRDQNLDMLASNLTLLCGKLPPKVNGKYGEECGSRLWCKGVGRTKANRVAKWQLGEGLLPKTYKKVQSWIEKWSES